MRPPRRILPIGLALAMAVLVLPSATEPGARAATRIRPLAPDPKPLTHEVYGYLPYWRLDAGTAGRLRYELLSTVAFFGIGIKGSGALDRDWVGTKAYLSDAAAAVTNAAHDRGVRVVPTFQLFDSDGEGGYPRMTKFLTNVAAQERFIAEALDLMAARGADGAGLDFEGPAALNPLADAYVAFVARFRAALDLRFPGAQLVNATSAGANGRIIGGLVPYVDRQMLMAYNYRWSGSTIAGAIAPLDHAARNVGIHMARMLQWAPADKVLLGVPYYGYDWPVKTNAPNAEIRTNNKKWGKVKSVTYASARDFLRAHPKVIRRYDALEGSAFYTYKDKKRGTWRQVYFDDERSLAAKYDYAIVTGLAGVGIWTLDNDRGYDELWDVLRDTFYAPLHAVAVAGTTKRLDRSGGWVSVTVRTKARVTGTVPERGRLKWTIRDAKGRLIRSGKSATETLLPGRPVVHRVRVRLGTAKRLKAGTYVLRVRFEQSWTTWRGVAVPFRQRY